VSVAPSRAASEGTDQCIMGSHLNNNHTPSDSYR
jgi:hypothetical protein